jgi:hypothetical protein
MRVQVCETGQYGKRGFYLAIKKPSNNDMLSIEISVSDLQYQSSSSIELRLSKAISVSPQEHGLAK